MNVEPKGNANDRTIHTTSHEQKSHPPRSATERPMRVVDHRPRSPCDPVHSLGSSTSSKTPREGPRTRALKRPHVRRLRTPLGALGSLISRHRHEDIMGDTIDLH